MKAISLKLPGELVTKSDECAESLRLSRAEYIRQAIERMNTETRNSILINRMKQASLKVRGESMRVNAEFAAIEEDPHA